MKKEKLKLNRSSHGTVAEKAWPKRYAKGDGVGLLTLHQNGSISSGKIVKVNDKIGIVSKVISDRR